MYLVMPPTPYGWPNFDVLCYATFLNQYHCLFFMPVILPLSFLPPYFWYRFAASYYATLTDDKIIFLPLLLTQFKCFFICHHFSWLNVLLLLFCYSSVDTVVYTLLLCHSLDLSWLPSFVIYATFCCPSLLPLLLCYSPAAPVLLSLLLCYSTVAPVLLPLLLCYSPVAPVLLPLLLYSTCSLMLSRSILLS